MRLASFKFITFACTLIGLSSGGASALTLEEINGKWNNLSTGESITFHTDGDVTDTRLGQGRADTTTVEYGANILIVYQNNRKCYYYLTLLAGNDSLNVAVRDATQPQPTCPSGVFVRTADE